MFNKLKGRISNFFSRIKKRNIPDKTRVFIQRRPLTSFVITLGILLLLIILGNIFKAPVKETPVSQAIKEVSILTLGKQSTAKVAGQVEKQGILQISAQTSGVVSNIAVSEGQQVSKGENLVSLSSNYQGGNAASISRQIAQKQFENNRDNFDTQEQIIEKQREVVGQNAINTDQMRQISVQSTKESQNLLDLNRSIFDSLTTNINNLETTNQGGSSDQLILQAKQGQAAVESAINSLQTAIRSGNFANDTNNPPTQLAQMNQEITLKQLDIQEKALTLNKEVSQLQLNLAQVSEAMMFPASPCSGVIQKIAVVQGDLVNPGSALVTISCGDRSVKVVAKVPQKIASSASMITESELTIANQAVELLPDFISTEATDGQLYQIIYTLPDSLSDSLTSGSFIDIKVPIGDLKSGAQFFIPLDSVFQTQDSAYVYVDEGDKAISKKITLGDVIGSEVEVLGGLNNGDRIILDRSVIAGDKVKVTNP